MYERDGIDAEFEGTVKWAAADGEDDRSRNEAYARITGYGAVQDAELPDEVRAWFGGDARRATLVAEVGRWPGFMRRWATDIAYRSCTGDEQVAPTTAATTTLRKLRIGMVRDPVAFFTMLRDNDGERWQPVLDTVTADPSVVKPERVTRVERNGVSVDSTERALPRNHTVGPPMSGVEAGVTGEDGLTDEERKLIDSGFMSREDLGYYRKAQTSA